MNHQILLRTILVLSAGGSCARPEITESRVRQEIDDAKPENSMKRQPAVSPSRRTTETDVKSLELAFVLEDALRETYNKEIVPLKVTDPEQTFQCQDGGTFTFYASQRGTYRKEMFNFDDCIVKDNDVKSGFEIKLNGQVYIVKTSATDKAIFSQSLTLSGKTTNQTFNQSSCALNFLAPQYKGLMCGSAFDLYESSDTYPSQKQNYTTFLLEFERELQPKHELQPKIEGVWTSSDCELDPFAGSYKTKVTFSKLTVLYEVTHYSDTSCTLIASQIERKMVYWLLDKNAKDQTRYDQDLYLISYKTKMLSKESLDEARKSCRDFPNTLDQWVDLIPLQCLGAIRKGTGYFSTAKVAETELILSVPSLSKSFRTYLEDRFQR
jgi:hypothetical protein